MDDDARRSAQPDPQPDPQPARHDSASRYVDAVSQGVDGFLTTAAGGTDLSRPFPDRPPLAPRSAWSVVAPLLLVVVAGAGYLGWRALS